VDATSNLFSTLRHPSIPRCGPVQIDAALASKTAALEAELVAADEALEAVMRTGGTVRRELDALSDDDISARYASFTARLCAAAELARGLPSGPVAEATLLIVPTPPLPAPAPTRPILAGVAAAAAAVGAARAAAAGTPVSPRSAHAAPAATAVAAASAATPPVPLLATLLTSEVLLLVASLFSPCSAPSASSLSPFVRR
jgi:hypothetical protein